jgi:hypothetical protein
VSIKDIRNLAPNNFKACGRAAKMVRSQAQSIRDKPTAALRIETHRTFILPEAAAAGPPSESRSPLRLVLAQSGRTSIGRPAHSVHLSRLRSVGISINPDKPEASIIVSRPH